MGVRDPRVDTYISRQQAFAQPILAHVRNVVHAACPTVVETIKWGAPFFEYNGRMMCYMSAFKEHAALGFWNAAMIDGLGAKSASNKGSAGNFGRLCSLSDLPSKRVLAAFVKAAMKLNHAVTAGPTRKAAPDRAPAMPEELTTALASNSMARTVFEQFAPSHRREYIEWIMEAKREATRTRRVTQAVEWIAEGKPRNWKYGA